mmetsp:Transcript_13793/g.39050  ORF Transcript_13793/g.39050 Transcript_13793/m.39050 type:complete len:242 (+) Transcript_13793:2874-3599(+)
MDLAVHREIPLCQELVEQPASLPRYLFIAKGLHQGLQVVHGGGLQGNEGVHGLQRARRIFPGAGIRQLLELRQKEVLLVPKMGALADKLDEGGAVLGDGQAAQHFPKHLPAQLLEPQPVGPHSTQYADNPLHDVLRAEQPCLDVGHPVLHQCQVLHSLCELDLWMLGKDTAKLLFGQQRVVDLQGRPREGQRLAGIHRPVIPLLPRLNPQVDAMLLRNPPGRKVTQQPQCLPAPHWALPGL